MNYDIFMDESGLFLESSSSIEEQELHEKGSGRKFPSQIAGIVCRNGAITSGNANSILKSACAAGGIECRLNRVMQQHNTEVFDRKVRAPVQETSDKSEFAGYLITLLCYRYLAERWSAPIRLGQ